jgi:uncharacterized protein (DUF1501 family)
MSPVEQPAMAEGVSRREFLRAGSLGVVGLSLGDQPAFLRRSLAQRRRAIFILMAGGASQLETFDPKPDAPASIRGPLKAISTSVPGLCVSESLPLLAQRMHKVGLVRSLCHDWAPIHETGQQLLQTGRVMQAGVRFPHFGSVVAQACDLDITAPVNAVLPRILRDTGVHSETGQSGGLLGANWNPIEVPAQPVEEADAVRRAYGDTPFGRLLLQARQMVERGTRCVTVNLFDALHQRVTWDCHADPQCAPGTLLDYRDTLCPQFDRALAALLDDLEQRGLLQDTLVVATGEFGRTPQVNDRGGRDHWTGCWSALVAGGGVTGGVVIGASDATASTPVSDPVSPAQIPATLLAWFGVDGQRVTATVEDRQVALMPAPPLRGLWPA